MIYFSISDRIQHPNNLSEGVGRNYEENQNRNFSVVSIEIRKGEKKKERKKMEREHQGLPVRKQQNHS